VKGVSDFHREVVATVLPVLEGYGFALAGGNALIAHGITSRPTRDVNLFTDQEGIIPHVTKAVESALRKAGFYVERIDTFSALLERWPEMADLRAEWTVARGRKQVMLQLGSNLRNHPPVTMEFGPVEDLRVVLATKILALSTRYEARDYIDVGSALKKYTAEELIDLAWSMEPGCTYEDFTSIGPALDELDDEEFTRYGLTQAEIVSLRKRFAAWPRHGSSD
jgi:Nucleotidyl transferase AbiEii toxin, Type IV TA system